MRFHIDGQTLPKWSEANLQDVIEFMQTNTFTYHNDKDAKNIQGFLYSKKLLGKGTYQVRPKMLELTSPIIDKENLCAFNVTLIDGVPFIEDNSSFVFVDLDLKNLNIPVNNEIGWDQQLKYITEQLLASYEYGNLDSDFKQGLIFIKKSFSGKGLHMLFRIKPTKKWADIKAYGIEIGRRLEKEFKLDIFSTDVFDTRVFGDNWNMYFNYVGPNTYYISPDVTYLEISEARLEENLKTFNQLKSLREGKIQKLNIQKDRILIFAKKLTIEQIWNSQCGYITDTYITGNQNNIFYMLTRVKSEGYTKEELINWLQTNKPGLIDSTKVYKTKGTIRKTIELSWEKAKVFEKKTTEVENKEEVNIYTDNDLPMLIEKNIGKCYIDELKWTFNIKRSDKLIQLTTPIRNQLWIDIKKEYEKCHKSTFDAYFESEFNIEYFNPVKDLLNCLKNEDSSEFDKLEKYFSFQKNAKLDVLKIKKWMLGVLTTIFNDGKHYDHMLIIKGRQDGGKTFFVRNQMLNIFLQINHICESFEYDKAKTTDQQKMLARHIICFDDESSFSKKEADLIKTILSSEYLQFVDKWDKDVTNKRRIATFIGTTNRTDIYDDETGGKRFQIIDLGENYLPGARVNGKLIREEFPLDWEKIWGYIYNCFLNGERHYDIVYDNDNSAYQTKNPLEILVEEYLEAYIPTNDLQLRNFRDIRNDVNMIAEVCKYNIKLLIDSKRGLTSALKMIFTDKLIKHQPRDTFYNVRIKPDLYMRIYGNENLNNIISNFTTTGDIFSDITQIN